MKICLVRHGETEWNSLGKLQGRDDIPLSPKGIEQVSITADYLKNFDWKVIITSPLLRAKKTAEIIAEKIAEKTGGIRIREEFDFIERDYGKASGMTPDERKLHFPDGNWAGAEPAVAVQLRTVNAFQKYINEYDGYDIIIVSHGAAINSILAYISNNETGSGKTVMQNGCMTLLEKTGSKIEIKYYNKVPGELQA